jgi:hypothetical protein
MYIYIAVPSLCCVNVCVMLEYFIFLLVVSSHNFFLFDITSLSLDAIHNIDKMCTCVSCRSEKFVSHPFGHKRLSLSHFFYFTRMWEIKIIFFSPGILLSIRAHSELLVCYSHTHIFFLHYTFFSRTTPDSFLALSLSRRLPHIKWKRSSSSRGKKVQQYYYYF